MKFSNQLLLVLTIPLFLFTACTKQEIDDQILFADELTETEVYELIEQDLTEMLVLDDSYEAIELNNRAAIPLAFEGQLNLTITPWYNSLGVLVGAKLRDRGTAMDNNGSVVNHALSARVYFGSGRVYASHAFRNPGRYFTRFRKIDQGSLPVANPDLQNILSGVYITGRTRGALAGQTGVGQKVAPIDQPISQLEDLLGLINVTATFTQNSNLVI